MTLIAKAIRDDDVHKFDMAIAGCDVHALTFPNGTALHVAAECSSVMIINYLVLRRGVHVDTATVNRTPLHSACAHGQLNSVRRLRELGANIHTPNTCGRTGVIVAAMHGHTNVVTELCTQAVHEQWANINDRDANKRTALITAVYNGHANTAIACLQLGADVNLCDASGRSPLMQAVRFVQRTSQERAKVAMYLLRNHQLNLRLNAADDHGETHLHYVALHSRYRSYLQQFTREQLADHINLPSQTGMTPLLMAVRAGKKEMAIALVKLGADINIFCLIDGQSPLIKAVVSRSENECVDYLLATFTKAQLYIDSYGANGKTALMYACERRNVAAVQLLIKHGANVNVQGIVTGKNTI